MALASTLLFTIYKIMQDLTSIVLYGLTDTRHHLATICMRQFAPNTHAVACFRISDTCAYI